MANHTILGGKVHLYKRGRSRYWQCSTYIAGKNRRTTTKQESLAQAKDFAEDWYPMLQRGFWLYVWKVETPKGDMLYVGRTGDNSSPNATAPYTRMGQHLGFIQTQNALRKNLQNQGVEPEECEAFHLIAHGPIYPEVSKTSHLDRAALMERHMPLRDLVGAMEKALAEDLERAGYTVLNTVKWSRPYDEVVWKVVRSAFAEHFEMLKEKAA